MAVRRPAVLSADYTGVTGWAPLISATNEAESVRQLFDPQAVTVRPALWDVLDVMRGAPQVDLIHVAMQGTFDDTGGIRASCSWLCT
jgi:hypothetical protein